MSLSDRLLLGGGGVLVGALYATLGLIMATDWRGLRTKSLGVTMWFEERVQRLPPWRWLGTGNIEARHRRVDASNRFIGWVFVAIGPVVGLASLLVAATAR